MIRDIIREQTSTRRRVGTNAGTRSDRVDVASPRRIRLSPGVVGSVVVSVSVLALLGGWALVFPAGCMRRVTITPDEIIRRTVGSREVKEAENRRNNRVLKTYTQDPKTGQWNPVYEDMTPKKTAKTKKQQTDPDEIKATRRTIEKNENTIADILTGVVISQEAYFRAHGRYAYQIVELKSLSASVVSRVGDFDPNTLPAHTIANGYLLYPINTILTQEGETAPMRDHKTGRRLHFAVMAIPIAHGETGTRSFLVGDDGKIYSRTDDMQDRPAVYPDQPARVGWALFRAVPLPPRPKPPASASSPVPQSGLAADAQTVAGSKPPADAGHAVRFDPDDPATFITDLAGSGQPNSGTPRSDENGSDGDVDSATNAGSREPASGCSGVKDASSLADDERRTIDCLRALYDAQEAFSSKNGGMWSVSAKKLLDAGRISREVFNAFILEPDSDVVARYGYFYAVFPAGDDQTVVIAWPKHADSDHVRSFLIRKDGMVYWSAKPLTRVTALPAGWEHWDKLK